MALATDYRLLAIFCGLALTATGYTDELRLDAKALSEQAAIRDVRLSADGTAIELEEGELFEDDGPAAGYSYLPNEERLAEGVWIKKELVIPRAAAKSATLLVGPGGELKASINGREVELRSPGTVGKYWQAYSLPVDVLKDGRNEFILFGSGKVWLARAADFAAGSAERAQHPNRSAKSTDAGTSWDSDRLGPAGDIDGEYYVRLVLNQFRSSGTLTLGVLDAGNLAAREVGPSLAEPVSIRVHCEAEGDGLQIRIRSGRTAVPDATSWSQWKVLDPSGELNEPEGRYFQLAVVLSTASPLNTPRLKSLRIAASPAQRDDWSAKLKVLKSRNAKIARSAVAFAYEPLNHPRLKALRQRHQLDDVAQGAKSELELIERLARWSANCWQSGHLAEGYPPWDALAILKPHADGKPVGGFCQQYNLVFLQACESFGIPGRAVSISAGDHGGKVPGSGHEVVELWSNQFGKWIYVDGNFAWYAVDDETGVPLSLLELRSRQLRALDGKGAEPIRVIHLRNGGKRWEGLESWPPFLELRLIPRSNFLEEKSPLPLSQGMRGWFWTGHYVWTDDDYPASLLYGNRVRSRQGWEWTLNQARYTLEASDTPGELRVHLDTCTPGFDTFLADVDGTGPKSVSSGFIWKLHAGHNRLEVWPRNIAGREGIASCVTIELP